MSIKVKFDGKYKQEYSSVSPSDVVLRGKQLFLQGVLVPIPEEYLYSVFNIIEDLGQNKYGTLFLVIRADATVEYRNDTFKKFGYYTASRILEIGTIKHYYPLSKDNVPSNDTYMVGGDNDKYWDKRYSGYDPTHKYGDNDR